MENANEMLSDELCISIVLSYIYIYSKLTILNIVK